MSGYKYIFDTNANITLFQENEVFVKKIEHADYIGISFISAIEFISFPALSLSDKLLFKQFLIQVEIAGASTADFGTLEIIAINKAEYKLKIPDIIIAHSAMVNLATLITNDKKISKVAGLKTISFKLN